jgi:hypothetical protein
VSVRPAPVAGTVADLRTALDTISGLSALVIPSEFELALDAVRRTAAAADYLLIAEAGDEVTALKAALTEVQAHSTLIRPSEMAAELSEVYRIATAALAA